MELFHYDLSFCARLDDSIRNEMVTNIWMEIMKHFGDMNLNQTVGLILFPGSNFIEYVDCDIEGDTGIILRAENVVSSKIFFIILYYFKKILNL